MILCKKAIREGCSHAEITKLRRKNFCHWFGTRKKGGVWGRERKRERGVRGEEKEGAA